MKLLIIFNYTTTVCQNVMFQNTGQKGKFNFHSDMVIHGPVNYFWEQKQGQQLQGCHSELDNWIQLSYRKSRLYLGVRKTEDGVIIQMGFSYLVHSEDSLSRPMLYATWRAGQLVCRLSSISSLTLAEQGPLFYVRKIVPLRYFRKLFDLHNIFSSPRKERIWMNTRFQNQSSSLALNCPQTKKGRHKALPACWQAIGN